MKIDVKYKNSTLLKAFGAFDILQSRKGAGNDFLGWMDLPSSITEDEINDYLSIYHEWKNKGIELIVVIGIGGSYLGAKAAIEALSHSFKYELNHDAPQVVFAGHNLSQQYHYELMELVTKRSVAVVVVSKSGTTTEPAIAFRILKSHVENVYGKEEAKRRIIAITDGAKGVLKGIANREGYRTFTIPDNVGGRFSVLTPVGLLPIALAGIDIKKMIKGAVDMEHLCNERIESNPAIEYAAARNEQYCNGKKIEILANFNPKLQYLGEWWKQLYGESEGKGGKGIFPASVNFTTDLHSMGQYIQDGERLLFETVISVEKCNSSLQIEPEPDNVDTLNFLSGREFEECNKMAQLGTKLAHEDGGVPNLRIEIEQLDPYNLGALFYFFEKACGISAYMIGVNPFDQPGVEAYKKNMFALLGKPGYEQAAAELKKRL